jgi:hypothetical protein
MQHIALHDQSSVTLFLRRAIQLKFGIYMLVAAGVALVIVAWWLEKSRDTQA